MRLAARRGSFAGCVRRQIALALSGCKCTETYQQLYRVCFEVSERDAVLNLLLSLAASHFPPPTAAGLATCALIRQQQPQKPAKGSSAPRARKGYPQASALRLCSPSPFPLPLRFVSRVGDPPPLALATPRLRQEAFGMYVHAAARFKGKGQRNSPRRKHP